MQVAAFTSSHMHMLTCIIVFLIASCIMTLRPLPACACLCHQYVLCSPDASLLAWHVQPVVMEMLCVQGEYIRVW